MAVGSGEHDQTSLRGRTLVNRGVYVVAYGVHARQCANELIRTIHSQMSGIPVCLASDNPLGVEDVFAYSKQQDAGARWQKTRVWSMAPDDWGQVLYLDADILLARNVGVVFEILSDGWDMVMTTSPPQSPAIRDAQRAEYRVENAYTVQALGSDRYPQLAGGVWAFQRNTRTRQFFKLFHQEWERFGLRDQQAMDRALYEAPVRVWVLGREFNWFMHHDIPNDEVHVMHFATAARDWVVKHKGRDLWLDWRKRV